jgi:outer membrane protein TolC
MRNDTMASNLRRLSPLLAALALAGCASVNIDQALEQTNQATQGFTQGNIELARTREQADQRRQLADQLLARPLAMPDAVQLALANSPTLQALLAQGWADLAAANQSGRLANPLLTFERTRFQNELELNRLLSVGLLDILTLPQRQAIAGNQAAQARVRLSMDVIALVAQVRQAWVHAVAAQQNALYAQQVNQAAQASAELARRMQQVGNFTKLQRARQHAFYADAVAQLALAQHAATAAREDLVRQLGLTDAQADRLQLPERLPDLPEAPRQAGELSASAMRQRLDVQLARLQLDGAGKAQGLDMLGKLVDVELGGRHDTVFDNANGQKASRNGFELTVRLPLFDWGDAQRAAMNAQTLAAANRYEATVRAAASQLRESYSAYRTAYDLARHYRDEIVPLHKTISEENVLRYNGMLIGVFELLADTREQIASVSGAINAQQQFWLADAGLSMSLLGRPLATPQPAIAVGDARGNDAANH